jgi:hypothetical protein
MKKTITTFLVCILAVLLLAAVGSGDAASSFGLARDRGVPKTDWYDVAQWEIDFCMNWGGTTKTVESGVGKMAKEATFISHNRIFALQAERSELTPSVKDKKLLSDSVVVYEVGWFVQPYEFDKDANYEIYLIGEDGDSIVLDSGNANYYNPSKGYYANESSVNFTKATLKVWNDDFEQDLEVDVV